MELYHWVKIHNVPDYRFARFNKRTRVMMYTDEEYDTFLHDPEWTRAETDLLLKLCVQHDLHFFVIRDKFYNYSAHTNVDKSSFQAPELADIPVPQPSGAVKRKRVSAPPSSSSSSAAMAASFGMTPDVSMETCATMIPPVELPDTISGAATESPSLGDKSIEDLKHRYYSVQQTLLKVRNRSDPDLKSHILFKYAYDRGYERERKVELAKLLTRTEAEEQQIAAAVLEYRKLSQAANKLKKQTKGRSKSTSMCLVNVFFGGVQQMFMSMSMCYIEVIVFFAKPSFVVC
jgi:SANT/Myb-like domain of DAMP1